MWCSKCQADVAAEMAADNRRLLCATCGLEMTSANVGQDAQPVAKTKGARELLDRWSSNQLLDPFGPSVSSPTFGEPASAQRGTVRSTSASHDKSTFRVDTSHSGGPIPASISANPVIPPHLDGQNLRVDQPQQAASPHIDVKAAVEANQKSKTNWQSFCGQILAYLGVLALTGGGAMVVHGYFGGPENYAPTGWLIATAGQMMLFLGVVTLVAGGIEQTSDEVSRQVESIGDRLIRIEQTSFQHALAGPHIPAEVLADGNSPPGTKVAQQA